jgi:hypothetical protein
MLGLGACGSQTLQSCDRPLARPPVPGGQRSRADQRPHRPRSCGRALGPARTRGRSAAGCDRGRPRARRCRDRTRRMAQPIVSFARLKRQAALQASHRAGVLSRAFVASDCRLCDLGNCRRAVGVARAAHAHAHGIGQGTRCWARQLGVGRARGRGGRSAQSRAPPETAAFVAKERRGRLEGVACFLEGAGRAARRGRRPWRGWCAARRRSWSRTFPCSLLSLDSSRHGRCAMTASARRVRVPLSAVYTRVGGPLPGGGQGRGRRARKRVPSLTA